MSVKKEWNPLSSIIYDVSVNDIAARIWELNGIAACGKGILSRDSSPVMPPMNPAAEAECATAEDTKIHAT